MDRTPISLFNAYDLQSPPYSINVLPTEEVILYCEARFRRALHAVLAAEDDNRNWMLNILNKELVSHIRSELIP